MCQCPEELLDIADMKYSCGDVEQLSPICNNQFLVKENDTCIVASQFLILIVLYLGEVNNLEL